ncbi:alpha/beta fold hydrolase [Actinoplanes sp. NPDC089786]|uniref:alpha/beta fold hydrolase n=1 Tax=Actinoplanes sp. NPDC089786 TaxID=3155185 RepID=UPI0034264875
MILVHGFGHASWCWSPVTERLAGRGVASVAIDLDGHGLKSTMPATSVTASSAAATLVEQIRRIGQGEPAVVVAHSMGGIVATAAAELEPALFARIVYVAAFAPAAGRSAFTYLGEPEFAGSLVAGLLTGDPAQTGRLEIDLTNRPAIREAFYGDVDPQTADAAIDLLSPGAPIGIPAEAFPVTRDRYGRVPHSFVTCAKDNAVPVAAQRRFIGEIDAIATAPTRVAELDTAHSPFLSRPDDLVGAILDLC